MKDILYLVVDKQVVAHNKNGWDFPDAKDYEHHVQKFLPAGWKSWAIIRAYKIDSKMKCDAICGKVR